MKVPLFNYIFGIVVCFITHSTTVYANPPQPNSSSSEDWDEKINTLIIQEVASKGIPSLQVAIGYENNIIFEQAYGFANIENQVPATTESKYRIASISKWLTATAAMALVKSEKLTLDAPIQQYCPQFPKKPWTITPRHLLAHTSGIRHYANYQVELESAKTLAERDAIEKRQAKSLLGRFTRYTDMDGPLDNFKNDELLFEPGTQWKYTSFGYRVLGCVLEGAAQKPYRTLMEQLVFQPADMQNTVNDDAWGIIPHRVSGYRLKDKKLRRANMRDISENLPAGGHLSTATDLVKFALAFNNDQMIDEKLKTLMVTPLNKNLEGMYRNSIWRDAIPSQANYSHGMMLFPSLNTVRVGHSGRQAGADSMVVLDPTKKLSIAILTNVKGYNGELALIEKIEAIIATAKLN